jgi:uncharacterized membrane protein YidH (DUF202 family)
MPTTSTKPTVKLIGLFTIIAGVLMIVAGGLTWGMVTTQLKAENITVSAVTDKNPGSLAGKPVAGPFTAYAQANAINHHALEGANGRTYAEIGADAKVLKAKLAKDGLSKEEIAKNPDVKALADTRDSTMNGSFLRASLFTSVIAFGVAALVMGLGVLFVLLGVALRKISSPTVITSAPSTPAAKSGVPVGAKA